ncbi:MAG: SGNH/GDSL hydrolase family protein [Alphaproteobacteria bacterium]|nr:SGNH/GDSL hydrolase family protein [Alphaproteobacteria bacterium]
MAARSTTRPCGSAPASGLGGHAVRVRLSNAYGRAKLAVGAAHVAVRAPGPGIVPGSDRRLTFCGSGETAIAAGALAVSDPVELEFPPLADLAISLYLPGDLPEAFGITGRYARQINYVSPPGDFGAAETMPVGRITDNWYFASAVEVMAEAGTAAVVALGDSLTDANISTLDAHCRWPDQLARRLAARRRDRESGSRPVAVMNQGLGGNRILHDLRGDSGLRRFDRDVLAQPGVTHAIVMLGTNDIRNRLGRPEEVVSAEAMIAGLHQLALRGQAHGIKMIGGTLTPFENETFFPGAWTPQGEDKRQAVNAWIRDRGVFDAVVDFDQALRDPSHPARMLPVYDCGDHLHPSDAGYQRMGDVIDLALFD